MVIVCLNSYRIFFLTRGHRISPKMIENLDDQINSCLWDIEYLASRIKAEKHEGLSNEHYAKLLQSESRKLIKLIKRRDAIKSSSP